MLPHDPSRRCRVDDCQGRREGRHTLCPGHRRQDQICRRKNVFVIYYPVRRYSRPRSWNQLAVSVVSAFVRYVT